MILRVDPASCAHAPPAQEYRYYILARARWRHARTRDRMRALILVRAAACCALILAAAAVVKTDGNQWRRPQRPLATSRGWSTTGCPCSNASLCAPIQRPGPEKVYAFHVDASTNGSNADWRSFDWSQISTLCLYGSLSPELLCHAHAHGVRITLGDGGTGYDFTDKAAHAWINRTVERVQSMHVDGINIDLEINNCSGRIGNCDNPDGWSSEAMANLTRHTAALTTALHAAVPGSHVSFDTPSLGLYEEGADGRGCGYMYGRNYDFKGLADAADFLLVMDYDSNDPALNGTFNKTGQYNGGYNPWRWPGKGPFASSGQGYANAGLGVIAQGVECYRKLGVPTSKLVMAFPWYSYNYQCEDRGAGELPPPVGAADDDWCRVVNASIINIDGAESVAIRQRIMADAIGGVRWNNKTGTPYLYYKAVPGAWDAGRIHRLDFDNPHSLALKAAYAKSVGARGVGAWTCDIIDYSNTALATAYWDSFKAFT
eukprot:COSAG02_NODE_10031_length_2043_cov_3.713992_1_plen_487_part_00